MATVHACDSCGCAVGTRTLLWRLWSSPAERYWRSADEIVDDWELCDACMEAIRTSVNDCYAYHGNETRCGCCGKREISRSMLWQLRSAPVEHGRLDGNEISEGWVLCEGCLNSVRASIASDQEG